MTTDKIITKIRGLLAKAESTTDEEAALLLDKAAELQAKYRIEQAQIVAAGNVVDDPIERRWVKINRYLSPKGSLSVKLANAFDAHVVWSHKRSGSGTLEFVGHRSDLDVIEALLVSLEIQLDRELLNVKGYSSADTRSRRTSFADGWCSTVGNRVKQHYAAALKTESAGTTGTDLVLLDRSQRVDAKYQELYGRRPRYSHGRRGGSNWSARASGREAGQRADIGLTGVRGSRGALGA